MRLTILRYDELPSTNTEAERQARLGAPEGLCIVARQQTEGRGRRQRHWVSPLDAGLYFSIVLRPRLKVEEWPLVTLMAAVAVSDALRKAYSLETDIKWPNDILAGGRKLCGVLAETVGPADGRANSGADGPALVLGIGINLRKGAFPPELRDAVSVEESIGREPSTDHVFRNVTQAIESRYSMLQEPDGARKILESWIKRSSFAHDLAVRVSLAEEVFEGITRGLQPDGSLRVETESGHIRIVYAGDVTALRRSSKV